MIEEKQYGDYLDALLAGRRPECHDVVRQLLDGLLPICSHCKKIRDDKGYWNQVESYIEAHSEALFSHGICPDCARNYYPDLDLYDDSE